MITEFIDQPFPNFITTHNIVHVCLQKVKNRLSEQRLHKKLLVNNHTAVEPVNIFNRYGGLYLVQLFIQLHPNQKYFIFLFDIKNFKNYDVTYNGYNQADYILNQLSKYLVQLQLKYQQQVDITPFRYGGDEFGCIVFGKDISSMITNHINNIFNKLNIEINGKIESYGSYNNQIKQGIFELYIQKNKLLNSLEVQNLYEEYQINHTILHNKWFPLPPKTNQRDFNKARKLCVYRKNSQAYRALNTLYRSVVIEPDLGREILSLESFISVLMQEKYTTILCSDIKFIKEINDTVSYVEADKVINKIIEIKNEMSICDHGIHNYILAKRGGVIFAAYKKLTKKCGEEKLQKYLGNNTHQVQLCKTDFELTVGKYKSIIDQSWKYRRNKHSYLCALIDTCITNAENNWYTQILTSYEEEKLIHLLDYFFHTHPEQSKKELPLREFMLGAFVYGSSTSKYLQSDRYSIRREKIKHVCTQIGYNKLFHLL